MSTILQVVTRLAPMHAKMDKSSTLINELLFGETLEVLSTRKDWVKARALRGGYEGMVNLAYLSDEILDPVYQVQALHSFIYKTPDVERPPLTSLPFLSRIALTQEEEDGFSQMEGGGWVWTEHLEDITEQHLDIAETALRFAETPYLWGGRTSRGIDCSGLVQIALHAAGLECPRDSHQQIECGEEISAEELRRNDLVFFDGHVGIMTDSETVLNATKRSMNTRIEKLPDMITNYEGGILSCRRVV